MAKSEISVKCNDGTKFRIKWDKKDGLYYLSYRNDLKPIEGSDGKFMGKWIYLDSQMMYCDVLAYMFEEITQIEAKEGY